MNKTCMISGERGDGERGGQEVVVGGEEVGSYGNGESPNHEGSIKVIPSSRATCAGNVAQAKSYFYTRLIRCIFIQ